MKKHCLMLAALGMAVACWAGDTPRMIKLEVTAAGVTPAIEYTAISDSVAWGQIDRVVVPPQAATGTVVFALCELGTMATNGVYAQYTETVASSGTIAAGGTYANRPHLYRVVDGTNTAVELYSGSLLKTTVTQAEASTNVWTILIYVK